MASPARDFVRSLHPPRFIYVVLFVIWGAFLTPHYNLYYLALELVALFLGLAVCGYALDELKGRHLMTSFSDRHLKVRAAIGAVAGGVIGVYLSFLTTWWFLVCVALALFFAVAYNYETLGAHSLWAFCLSWGFFPVVGSTLLQAWPYFGLRELAVSCAFGSVAAVMGLFHIRAYGFRPCPVSKSCKELAHYKSIGPPWGGNESNFERVCHGMPCNLRLSIMAAKPIRTLAKHQLWTQTAILVALTAAIAAWRVMS